LGSTAGYTNFESAGIREIFTMRACRQPRDDPGYATILFGHAVTPGVPEPYRSQCGRHCHGIQNSEIHFFQ